MMLAALFACATSWTLDGFQIDQRDDGGLDVRDDGGDLLLTDLRVGVGEGDEVIAFSAGNYRVDSGSTDWTTLHVAAVDDQEVVLSVSFADDGGAVRASALVSTSSGVLVIDATGDGNRVRLDAACTGDDHFAGLGEMQQDVDHVGEAFALWVGEPGIGKSTDEEPDGWPIEGARHASSYPDPFVLRPEPVGLELFTPARVDVDLCTGDRWWMGAWSDAVEGLVYAEDTALDVVRARNRLHGTAAAPPDWVLAPWVDAIRGADRVRTVTTELRDAGAPASVVWTEDWKGGEDGATGYHIADSWDLDATLYPEASALDAELEAAGFKWFAYFSPFLTDQDPRWAETQDLLIETADGEPYTFVGASLTATSVLDLTRQDAAEWALARMDAARAVGFDGWMADFAEWLPPDATLRGADALDEHNLYPLWWQDLNAQALDGGAMFTRSGWIGSPSLSPVHWPGDQRTSFDGDDGLPTVVPAMIGNGLSGVPLTGSDIAGYQTIGNDPSTRELWFRWCTLGAFSPLMRTHHGAYDTSNWQFDTDAETLAHFATWARHHTALFPYLRGVLAEALVDGTPSVAPVFLRHADADWALADEYLLGPALLVAPVLEAGATSRAVTLPASVTWYDWWTGAVVTSGTVAAAVDSLPVFAHAGAVVPVFDVLPDTLVDGPLPGLLTAADVDGTRTVHVYAGAAGSFEEADGTRYETDGIATTSGSSSAALSTGTVSAGGLTLRISGTTSRTYTLVVHAP